MQFLFLHFNFSFSYADCLKSIYSLQLLGYVAKSQKHPDNKAQLTRRHSPRFAGLNGFARKFS